MQTELAKEKTSEEIYGISKQPPPTCPMIDKAIGEIDDTLDYIRRYEKASEEEMRDMLWRVELNLGSLVGYGRTGLMEDIRENVDSIRCWGQEWKELAIEHAPTDEEGSKP